MDLIKSHYYSRVSLHEAPTKKAHVSQTITKFVKKWENFQNFYNFWFNLILFQRTNLRKSFQKASWTSTSIFVENVNIASFETFPHILHKNVEKFKDFQFFDILRSFSFEAKHCLFVSKKTCFMASSFVFECFEASNF